jgi:hypothetical protein
MRKCVFKILLILLLTILSCAEELDYPEQAKAFHAKYAKSREMNLLLRYGVKRRNRTLYLQECEPTPDDSVKTWAIYENYPLDDAGAKIELTDLKIAFTPFDDPRGGRIIPEYETIGFTDTTGGTGQTALQICEAIHAFNRLGMREVICGGQGVVYFVQPKFMLIHVADSAKVPEGIKNVATKLDENWYFEISFEHQDEQRRKLGPALREFLQTVQEQKAPQQMETNK